MVVKSGQVFDNVQRAVHFKRRNREVNRMLSIAKKRLSRKKYKEHLLSSFQKTKSTQVSGISFADRIDQVKKNKFEMKLIKTVDFFLYSHGKYTGNLVTFKKKVCKLTIF